MSKLKDLSESGIRELINHLIELVKANKESEDMPKPTPKFKVGDKVIIDNIFSAYDGKVGTITHVRIRETVDYGVKIQNDIIAFNEDSLAPYTEPTYEEKEEKEPKLFDVGTVSEETANRLAKQLDSLRAIQSDTSSLAWQPYRMELAAKIAVVLAQKGHYEPSEIGAKAVEVAN